MSIHVVCDEIYNKSNMKYRSERKTNQEKKMSNEWVEWEKWVKKVAIHARILERIFKEKNRFKSIWIIFAMERAHTPTYEHKMINVMKFGLPCFLLVLMNTFQKPRHTYRCFIREFNTFSIDSIGINHNPTIHIVILNCFLANTPGKRGV